MFKNKTGIAPSTFTAVALAGAHSHVGDGHGRCAGGLDLVELAIGLWPRGARAARSAPGAG